MTSTSEAIIPKFDDDDEDGGRKLAIICSKGNLDMAYPGLILANAALGEGVEVHLFFTFWGFDMINKKTMHELKFSPVGNTATHMPTMLSGLPGIDMPDALFDTDHSTPTTLSIEADLTGEAYDTDDGVLDLSLAYPKEVGGPDGDHSNPEQLLAAGWSACFRTGCSRSTSRWSSSSRSSAGSGIRSSSTSAAR